MLPRMGFCWAFSKRIPSSKRSPQERAWIKRSAMAGLMAKRRHMMYFQASSIRFLSLSRFPGASSRKRASEVGDKGVGQIKEESATQKHQQPRKRNVDPRSCSRAHVFAVNIFRNPDKASSCNAYHRRAENDKRQACPVAKF